jgi:hypothetical protein
VLAGICSKLIDYLKQYINFEQLALKIIYRFSVKHKLPADLRLRDLSSDYSINKQKGG